MTRSLAVLAAAPIAAAALAAAAAGPAAAAPAVQTARFSVDVFATQTTTWKQVPAAATRDCSAVTRGSGSGRETVTMRTRRPYTVRATRYGRFLALGMVVSARNPEALMLGTVDRQAKTQVEEVAGTCGDNAGGVTAGGPYDCGTQKRRWAWNLTQKGRTRLGLLVNDTLLATLTDGDQSYETCPVYTADGVAQAGVTPITQDLPAADLMDPEQRQHIVLAQRTFRLSGGGLTGRTTVRWEVRLTRK